MSLPVVIDIEAIRAPISGEAPAGIDPRESASNASPYYRLKDARGAARAMERAAVEASDYKPELWDVVVDLGTKLLSTQAKDLEAAAWLTEALVRVEGFAGLRDGLTIITDLAETYWEDLYPRPDEDGLEIRVSPVAGLSGSGATGTLDRPIRNTPLTDGAGQSFSFWHFEQANDLEKITDSDKRQARIEDGAPTLETFRRSVAETPAEHLRDTLATLGECETVLARLTAVLDEAAGPESPSFTPLQELLAAIAGCVRHVAADRLMALTPDTVAPEAVGGTGAPASGTAGPAAIRRPGEFSDREEALALLGQIGVYFRRTEPHSPISYTIEHAVRRARLPLPELLKELAQDPEHMQHILATAGIKFSEPDE